MGVIDSFVRLVSSILGQAEGGTERATDKMLTSSPEAIKNQFRKTREDWVKDYNEMLSAISQLSQIKESKEQEVQKLREICDKLSTKMEGAITLYKQNPDERLKEEYSKLAFTREEAETKIKGLQVEVSEQEKILDSYKGRLFSLREDIEKLKQEEAETVADIVSSKKIKELNAKLDGLSKNYQTKNLETIRETRKLLVSEAKLGSQIAGIEKSKLDDQLLGAGKISKHIDAFDKAVKLDTIFISGEKTDTLKLMAKKEEENVKVSAKKKVDDLFT